MNALIKLVIILMLAVSAASLATWAYTEMTTKIYTLEVLGNGADEAFTKDFYK